MASDDTVKALPPRQLPWPICGSRNNLPQVELVAAITKNLEALIPRDRLSRAIDRSPRAAIAKFVRTRATVTGTWSTQSRIRAVDFVTGRMRNALCDALASALIGAWANIVRQAIVETSGTHALLDASLLPKREIDERSVRSLRRAGYRTPRWIDALEYALVDLLGSEDVRALFTVFVSELRKILDADSSDGMLIASALTEYTFITIHRGTTPGTYIASLTTV